MAIENKIKPYFNAIRGFLLVSLIFTIFVLTPAKFVLKSLGVDTNKLVPKKSNKYVLLGLSIFLIGFVINKIIPENDLKRKALKLISNCLLLAFIFKSKKKDNSKFVIPVILMILQTAFDLMISTVKNKVIQPSGILGLILGIIIFMGSLITYSDSVFIPLVLYYLGH